MAESTITTVTVGGMTCGHCVAAVQDEVGQIPGVTDVAVDLPTGARSRSARACRRRS